MATASIDTALRPDAERCLAFIYERFQHTLHMGGVVYPLTDLRCCRAFADAVTTTLEVVRGPDSRLPPTALVLAMLAVCRELINPPADIYHAVQQRGPIPRAFAYEMIDRLRAEMPATSDLAIDQIGRIIAESGTLREPTRLHEALVTYRARLAGALSLDDLDRLVTATWRHLYPSHADMLIDTMRRAA